MTRSTTKCNSSHICMVKIYHQTPLFRIRATKSLLAWPLSLLLPLRFPDTNLGSKNRLREKKDKKFHLGIQSAACIYEVQKKEKRNRDQNITPASINPVRQSISIWTISDIVLAPWRHKLINPRRTGDHGAATEGTRHGRPKPHQEQSQDGTDGKHVAGSRTCSESLPKDHGGTQSRSVLKGGKNQSTRQNTYQGEGD